jgi:hypothetical protein
MPLEGKMADIRKDNVEIYIRELILTDPEVPKSLEISLRI